MSPAQKNGKVSCSDCPSWKARNLCAHSLAAAEKIGKTVEFLQWFQTKGLKQINLTALVTCDSAKGVGKKGKKATGVRKGGRNAGKAPPTVVVDSEQNLFHRMLQGRSKLDN